MFAFRKESLGVLPSNHSVIIWGWCVWGYGGGVSQDSLPLLLPILSSTEPMPLITS